MAEMFFRGKILLKSKVAVLEILGLIQSNLALGNPIFIDGYNMDMLAISKVTSF